MERRHKEGKAKAKLDHEEEVDNMNPSFVLSDSDDEEANEDLSLKIVKKAISRTSYATAGDGVDSRGLDVTVGEVVVATESVASKAVKRKSKKEKKKKTKNVETEIQTVTLVKEEDIMDKSKDAEVVKLSESDAVDNSNSDNVVLRRLLRGPRYFDPPDKSWGACFNCGEEGHSAANCTSARRKKPCFICGSLEHEVKQCQKGQDCFICKERGHRAKDCPKKFKHCSQGSKLCLKCGTSAHDMSSCHVDYSLDDLKEIQCYVCKRFGHLCCVNYFHALPSGASCYKCGQTGHNGQECRGSRGETSAAGTPSSCFKCGEEGHFARECTNSAKPKKRTRDLSTPTGKHSKGKKANKGYESAPQDFGKTHKKKLQFDDGSPNWSSKPKGPKRRGGWITDDPVDLPPRNGWWSPATPNKKHKVYGWTAGGQGSSLQSAKKWGKFSPGTLSSQGYAKGYQHRFSASRFGNSSSDGMRRNYDWW